MPDYNYQQDTAFYGGDTDSLDVDQTPLQPVNLDDLTLDFQMDCHRLYKTLEAMRNKELFDSFEVLFAYLYPGSIMGTTALVRAMDFQNIKRGYRAFHPIALDRNQTIFPPQEMCVLKKVLALTYRKILINLRATEGFLEG